MSRIALVALLAAAACGGGGHGDDDDSGVDAGMAGLVFRVSSPDLGQLAQDTTISQVKMHVRDVRALGDASTGTGPTYLDRTDLDLTEGDVKTITFDQAPPGRYSSLDFAVDRPQDGEYAWELRGTTVVDGNTWSIEVEDDQSTSLSLPLDLQLDAGHVATIDITLTVNPICEPIDWSQVPEDGGGSLEIHDLSPEMPGLRSRFATAFAVSGVDVQ
jgi:hypothetical protein